MKRTQPLIRIFDLGFALAFAFAAAVSLLCHDNPFLDMGALQLAAVTLLLGAAVLLGTGLWRKYGRVPGREKIAVGAMLCLYFAAQLIFGLLMQVGMEHTWDYAVVCRAARDFVLDGVPPGDYFALFSNNGPLFWVYVGFFSLQHLFGITNFMPGLVLFNAAAVNLALLFYYLCARRLFGSKWALAALLAAMLHPALLLYTPIAYTDTLTLPFVTGALLLWLRARAAQEEGRQAMCPAIGAFLLAAAGAALKFSVAILAVAFLIDLLLLWRGRARFAALAACLGCFALLWTGIGAASRAAMPDFEEEGVPFTHWIMMGLHGNGGYWDPDYQLTLQYDSYEDRAAFTRQEILRRLQEMGPSGLAVHTVEKLSYIVSDGCCYAQEKLNRSLLYINPLHRFIIPGEAYSGFLYYAADGYQLLLWILCAAGGLMAFLRRDAKEAVIQLACFGLLLFLLIWEARSRYLVNFLPLYLLCAFAPLAGRQMSAEREADEHT